MTAHSRLADRESLDRRLQRLFVVLVIAAAWCAPAQAQIVDSTLWVTNGTVQAIGGDGNTIYIGGTFTTVGPATGGGVLLDAVTGVPARPFPKVLGSVHAVASDGMGGWYIGGLFQSVGGKPRSNLAHIDSNGGVADWSPTTNDIVHALAVSGTTVYVGGEFTSVSAQPRNYIAAVEGATGEVTPWNPDAASWVLTLAVSGNTVFAGGYFAAIGGQSRKDIAALDATTGLATEWDPYADATVYCLAIVEDRLYVGGAFANVGGQPRSGLAALDVVSGAATEWNPSVSHSYPDEFRSVMAMTVRGNALYVGGSFTAMGQILRRNVASFDLSTGGVTAWRPNVDGYVRAIAADANAVYVGGDFTHVGGQVRQKVAGIDITTAAPTPWNPVSDNSVLALAVNGTTVYTGGEFTSMGGVTRNNIAALNAATGAATAWNPNALGDNRYPGTVMALAIRGGTVYAGGAFMSIGGQSRQGVAALDALTGAATPWNPAPAPGRMGYTGIRCLAVRGDVVYAAGAFGSIGGQLRENIAALDAVSGLATAWDPGANEIVYAMAVDGNTIYAGGHFNIIGGGYHQIVAALDSASSVARPWDPYLRGSGYDPYVFSLAVSGNTVYIGGSFGRAGSDTRNGLAAVDASTGAVSEWNPNARTEFYSVPFFTAIAPRDGVVYVAGYFNEIGGESRKSFAALDAATGAARPCPTVSYANDYGSPINVLTFDGHSLYAGGNFAGMGGLPQHGLARMGSDVATETLLSRFDARAVDDAVMVRWVVRGPSRAVAIERAERMVGPWADLPIGRVTDGELTSAFDRGVAPGMTYWYRLVVTLEDGARLESDPIEVAMGVVAKASGITAVSPNPVLGVAHIDYVVTKRERVRLSVWDVAGRHVETLSDHIEDPGPHGVLWSSNRVGLRSGVYFLRWEASGREMQVPVVLVR